ncbi:MAG: helix-turn-helix transcriptional regulator [Bacilli bacterium]|nr:helix-turn-helix transcriptional regulator [Bacilli bacterium]
MSSISKVKIENGVYLFKLNNILKDKNISINKISRDTNTDFKVIKRLITGELVKIDIFVLARVCDYLDCTIEDLVEYKQEIKSNC